ncbi:hypothetical protein ACIQV3_31335 [Streptomyces sp. NPDC099050]|uniref:hypothetical protein n=1 Tax=Streptomyces sp. NPDC099050 TaxID=3366100 RepID=UPI00381FE725
MAAAIPPGPPAANCALQSEEYAITDLPRRYLLARQLQDQPAYGSLSPRLREVAEDGWERFLEGLADGDRQPDQ